MSHTQAEMEGERGRGGVKERRGGEEKAVEMCGTHQVCTQTQAYTNLYRHTPSLALSLTHTHARVHTHARAGVIV